MAVLVSAPFAWALSTAPQENLDYEYLYSDTPDVTAVIESTEWQRGFGQAQFGYTQGHLWLRYKIPKATHQRVLVIENPWLFRFDAYLFNQGTETSRFELGSARPMDTRPIASSNFAIPIAVGVDTIYLFDSGESASNFPVTLMDVNEFSRTNGALNLFHGFYYGLVLIMVLYNLALFTATRDKAYLSYSLYAASLMGFLTAADGSGALFLWPESPELQYVATALAWGLSFFFLIQFARQYLALTGAGALVCRGTQVLVVIAAALTLFFPNSITYTLQTTVSAIVVAALFYVGIVAALNRSTAGYIFLAANGAFGLGALIHIAMLFGWIMPSAWLHHSVHVGSILELAILAGGLVLRVRQVESQRFEAMNQAQELERRNRELRTAKTLAEEHRQLQKSLQQAQKLKTIGQLAGGFAHDFNNILASILGFAELAQSPKTERNTLNRYLSEIISSGERGAALVRQLLVYSRNTPPEPKDLDLTETLVGAQELLRGSLPATISLEITPPRTPVYIHSDPEQLQQVLVNLCLNAAEATHNRGKIEIIADIVELDSLTCTSCLARFSGRYITIKVEDDGPGIKGNASDLFTPFNTTKAVGQGTGLGLSVVHGITHEHGGHVHAANRASEGARFAIYLPEASQTTASPEGSGRRILVIEDDPSVATYLGAMLGEADFAATIKRLPTEALESIVANPNAFDLVITDHLMPQGTGIELAEDIHALRPDLPVLLTTGNENNITRADLDNAGISAVFQKPLNSDQLLAKIRALLAA